MLSNGILSYELNNYTLSPFNPSSPVQGVNWLQFRVFSAILV